MIRQIALCCTLSLLPVFAMAQTIGPASGEREITLSGSGGSDRNFDSGNFSISGDYGWYTNNNMLIGIRQSVQYQNIEGATFRNDFWNGSTRGFVDWHFGQANWRPFVGASLGAVYGDGLRDSGFAGLELGFKYYVLPKTFIMARGEYQWFFRKTRDIDHSFDDGAWVYTLGMGYNF